MFVSFGGETKSTEEVGIEVKANQSKGDGGGTEDRSSGVKRGKGGGEKGGEEQSPWWGDRR